MRTLVVLATLLLLSACSLPVFFRVPVVQGNVVTAKEVKKLEIGMTKRQVKYVMGTPLIDSSFEKDRWDYVFYYRDPRAHVRQSELNLFFVNDKLSDIEGDDEYTAQILGDDGQSQEQFEDTPLPAEATPGANNERLTY
ncbi:outer membrane protein assembly factor BamE [Salinisphaera aquimarina]|uniref:Outer membrane protein assembly factor BamE n=1 Tax=Salinisphaera aquimarina TaxID=2094031 RepID=A0ABV7EVA8_9GAMM